MSQDEVGVVESRARVPLFCCELDAEIGVAHAGKTPLLSSDCSQFGYSSRRRQFRLGIEQAVSRVFQVSCRELRMVTRGRAKVALARQVAMYLTHVVYGLSLTEVGRVFDRDRTTVSYACGVVEDRRDNPAFDRALNFLESVILVWAVRPSPFDCDMRGDCVSEVPSNE